MAGIGRQVIALEELQSLRSEAAEVQIIRADGSAAWLVVDGLCNRGKVSVVGRELARAVTVRETSQGEQCRSVWSVNDHGTIDITGLIAFCLSCHRIRKRLIEAGCSFSHCNCVVSRTRWAISRDNVYRICSGGHCDGLNWASGIRSSERAVNTESGRRPRGFVECRQARPSDSGRAGAANSAYAHRCDDLVDFVHSISRHDVNVDQVCLLV